MTEPAGTPAPTGPRAPDGGWPVPAVRGMILASAGAGKTYRLSAQLVALLASGVPPSQILASTFTRKAAGEIRSRVLEWLAEAVRDPAEAARLAGAMPTEALRSGLGPEVWPPLLGRTVRGLHRFQVHTLDAFFHRVLRVLAPEVGLPEGWGVAGDAEAERVRARAVEGALAEADPEAVLELVRLSGRGGADRALHGRLLEAMSELHRTWRELDPAVADPWGFAGGTASFSPAPPAQIDAAIERLAEADLPLTARGAPVANWVRDRERLAGAARERDWEEFLQDKGMVPRILDGTGTYSGHPILPAVEDPLRVLLEAARGERGPRHQRRIEALGRFVSEYDARLRRIQEEERLFDHEALTWVLAEGGISDRRDELYYRLDGVVRHILLDEFQDTSIPQWRAIEPLVEEVLSGHEGERAALVVADPKQSIYGWRGGEPRILDRIVESSGIPIETIAENYRSSTVLLDFVNTVFERVRHQPVLAGGGGAVKDWLRAYAPHHSGRSEDLPGEVVVEVGPPEESNSRRKLRPELLSHTVARIEELHASAPSASIGVLTRTNDSAAWLIAGLRRVGIEASEEGGVPVLDSAPVRALLALLRLADHPGDRIAAYLVGRTPVGRLVGLAEGDWNDAVAVDRVARTVRRRLLLEGYGRLIGEWVRELGEGAPDRDRMRLRQLAELAFRWDARATARPMDFVRHVERARVQDAASSAVRVMTVHRAKGLEFDIVVLPELDAIAFGGEPDLGFLPLREGPAGPVVRVFPHIRAMERGIFPEPELSRAVEQAKARELRDGLSALYVALTRARYALHVILRPDPPRSAGSIPTGGTLLRAVLGAAVEGGEAAGERLVHLGSGTWRECIPETPARSGVGRSGAAAGASLLSAPRGTRLLPRRVPSDLEGGGKVDPVRLLRGGAERGMGAGTVVHAWLERIGWLEEGIPDRAEFLRVAQRVAPGVDGAEALLDRTLAWIEQPAIRELLVRERYPAGTLVEHEVPFVVRDGPFLLQGFVDRLVRIPSPEGGRLLVVDWKTDAVDPSDPEGFERRAQHYRPQLEAYLTAVSRTEGVPPERVEGVLAFLRPGRVIPLRPSSS